MSFSLQIQGVVSCLLTHKLGSPACSGQGSLLLGKGGGVWLHVPSTVAAEEPWGGHPMLGPAPQLGTGQPEHLVF